MQMIGWSLGSLGMEKPVELVQLLKISHLKIKEEYINFSSIYLANSVCSCSPSLNFINTTFLSFSNWWSVSWQVQC